MIYLDNNQAFECSEEAQFVRKKQDLVAKQKNQTGYPGVNRRDNSFKNATKCNRSCSEFYASKIQRECEANCDLRGNEFVPFVSRSVWDRNRQNIKKIGAAVSKILNIKKRMSKLKKESITKATCNENIDKFIKSKLNLETLGIHDHKNKRKRMTTCTTLIGPHHMSIDF